MVFQQEIKIQKTPLDVPILLFLASQIISTILSIDIHTSVWGYYSRSNGGLASIFCYIFLYYAFVSNFSKEKVARLLLVAIGSATIVSIYGVLEHFGINKDYWVQDVQNRVFSTLGQPNWLAAYLSVLIPVAIAFGLISLQSESKAEEKHHVSGIMYYVQKNSFILNTFYILLATLFYITLLFTKSRSGFLGFWIGMMFLIGAYYLYQERLKKYLIKNTKYFILSLLLLLGITFYVGSPFEQLNRFTLQGLQKTNDQRPTTKPQGTALETGGGTESGEIRKIVWKGTLEIARAYPLFGSGVETFAYSYYKFRPIEHNQTSEWDFLYNKAHNEYLNYLANTGLFGLGSYLLMIGTFIVLCIRYYVLSVKQKIHDTYYILLTTSLLAGYISILVSNFFGFSVVIINLFFFLIPAFVFVLNGQLDPNKTLEFSLQSLKPKDVSSIKYQVSGWQGVIIFFIILTTYYLLLTTYRMWDADRSFATGKSLGRAGEYSQAYSYLVDAIEKRPGEPVFVEELSINTSALSVGLFEQDESTLSAQFVKEAVKQSDYTVRKSPNNTNFWRSRIRVFYTLSQIDEAYITEALAAAKKTSELSPTDPKISYNYGLILGQNEKVDEAIAQLEYATKLKPDYRDPVYALGLFYYEKATEKKGIVDQELLNRAILQMENVLKISSRDTEAKEKLREWRGF